MDRERLARRLRLIEELENPICFFVGFTVAVVYFFARLFTQHVIANLSWTIPFLVVFLVMKFAFAMIAARTERLLRTGPELPAARAVQVRRRSSNANTIKPSTIPVVLPPLPVSQQPAWGGDSVQDGAVIGPRILVDGTSARTDPS